MNREEHLAWAKQRAIEYVDAGDLRNAVVSMGSDLRKYPDFANVSYTLTFMGLMEIPHGKEAVRHWIEGFK